MTPEPIFFPDAAAWRAWLAEHHTTATEIQVGYYKKHTGKQTLTWEMTVREALCFGWIDGQLNRIDDERHMVRFTPRKPRSRWSKVNLRLMEELEAAGLMTDAGRAAFALRDPSDPGYSLAEQPDRLPDPYEAQLREDPAVAAFWDACPPGYRRRVSFWVESAKRDETRAKRVEQLREACAKGERLAR